MPRDKAYEMVWADDEGSWVCPETGNEHVPGEPKRPVQVTITFNNGETRRWMRLSLAEYGNFIVTPDHRGARRRRGVWDAGRT